MMRARGFTLLELLIAVAITAVIGALVAGSFQRAAAARSTVEAQDERFGGARLALTRMAREVSEAYLSDHYDQNHHRERLTVFRGRDRGEQDDLLFATFSHLRLQRDAKESDQAVVEYSVDADPDRSGEQALWRREKPHIDDEPERGGSKAMVLAHVVGFDVQYWDWKKQEWVREWDTSTSERQGMLPTRVRFALKLSMPDRSVRSFETETRIAIIRPLDF